MNLLVGIHAVDPTWSKNAHVTPNSDEDAHTVTKIGDTIIDFTARQFDTNAKFPKISTISDFRREWKEVEPSTKFYA